MNLRFWLPLILCLSVFALDAHGDPACGPNDQPKITSESAVVEDVLAAGHDDYQYRDYIVRWRGNRVAVTNPMAISRHAVGDTISVVVSRRTNAGDQALRFTNIERYVPQAGDKMPTTDAHESIHGTGIGTVEEVLRAEDDPFHYVAYIVKWQDSRIAITDNAPAHFVAGDSIEFAISGSGVANHQGLMFFLIPKKESLQRGTTTTTSKENGTIDAVLTAQAEGGYNYRAYVVEWRGTQVVLQDYSSTPSHVPGELIPLLLERPKQIDGSVIGHVRLDPGEQLNATTTGTGFSGKTTQTTEVSNVDEVIEAKVDGLRYVSYFVNWHGQRVAVNDYSATTHYAPKDPISFTVTRMSIPTGMTLSFNIFTHDPPPPRSTCERPTPTSTSINPSKTP